MTGSLVCAIAGGSGSGKTTLARRVDELLGDRCDLLAIDWYYRDLAHLSMAERQAVNYDHPDSLELDRWCADLDALRAGHDIEAPVYDFSTHTRSAAVRAVKASEVIVTEGILVLAAEQALPRFDVAVFIDVDNDLRLSRRLARDVTERGRDRDDVLRQWNQFVAPMHSEFVAPSKANATRLISGEFDIDAEAESLCRTLTQLTRPSQPR